MTPRRRLVIGLSVGITLTFASLAYFAIQIARGEHRGSLGLYIAPRQSGPAGAPTVAFPVRYQPGHVILVLPRMSAELAGIRSGDLVLKIDGIPLDENDRILALNERLRTGDRVRFELRRNGVPFDKSITVLSPLRNPLLDAQLAVVMVVGFAFLIAGMFVFSRRPDDKRAAVFYTMCLAAGISSILSSSYSVTVGSQFLGQTTAEFIAIGAATTVIVFVYVPLTLHLGLIFPRDRDVVRTQPKIFWWVYGVPFYVVMQFAAALVLAIGRSGKTAFKLSNPLLEWAGGLLALFAVLAVVMISTAARRKGIRAALGESPVLVLAGALALSIGPGALLLASGWRRTGVLVLLAPAVIGLVVWMLYPVVTCLCFYRSYREAGQEEKRQIAWPLWGLITAVGTRVLVLIVSVALTTWMTAEHADPQRIYVPMQALEIASRPFSVLVPLAFIAAIFKYRLMDIDIIIRKTVVYSMLSGGIIVVYLAVVGILGTILVSVAGIRGSTMTIAATLLVAVVFVPVRNQLQRLVDRNLFRQKIDYAQALRAVSSGTMIANDATAFLNVVAEKVQQALQNRSVVIFVRRASDFVATAKLGVTDALVGVRVPAAFEDLLERPFNPRRRQLPEEAEVTLRRIGASLVVPIRSEGRAQAFMALGEKLSDREFDVDDIDFLISVADQVAMGMDRIRLQREESEFTQARDIQAALLPRDLPQLDGLAVAGSSTPARVVGGDYFDVLKLNDTSLALCIGDVAGKGMPAALMMSALQAAVRASAGESRSPAELCERIRRVVVPSLSGGRFVTFFYCTIDEAAGKIEWCNAGHNPPVLVRADGSIERLAGGGPALSRLFREPFVTGASGFAQGDRLVLFTDGLSEAHDEGGHMYGEDRIETLSSQTRTGPPSATHAALVEDLARFAGGEPEDDVTLLVAGRVTPRA